LDIMIFSFTLLLLVLAKLVLAFENYCKIKSYNICKYKL